MNLITQALPDYIEIEGDKLRVKTDYRVWLAFADLCKNCNVENVSIESYWNICSKCVDLLVDDSSADNYYPTTIFPALVGFYSETNGNHGKTISTIPQYDLKIDSDAIFASFLQQYGIRLTEANLHWYEFRALFANLADDTPFGLILRIRGMKESDVPKEKRSELRRVKEQVKLPVFESYKEEETAVKNLREALKNMRG